MGPCGLPFIDLLTMYNIYPCIERERERGREREKEREEEEEKESENEKEKEKEDRRKKGEKSRKGARTYLLCRLLSPARISFDERIDQRCLANPWRTHHHHHGWRCLQRVFPSTILGKGSRQKTEDRRQRREERGMKKEERRERKKEDRGEREYTIAFHRKVRNSRVARMKLP